MAYVAITTLGSKIIKEMGSVVNEIFTQVDAQVKRKIVQKKINDLENDKESTCHSE